MKRKRFSVEQSVAILKQAELGTPVANRRTELRLHMRELALASIQYGYRKIPGAADP